MTIEIWEMVVVVFLALILVWFTAHFNDSDSIQAGVFTNQINYIGYLSENLDVQIKIPLNDKTKLNENNGQYQIIVNEKESKKKISKDLLTIKQEGATFIIS